ncbi:DUF4974 domain-containing protein [Niastella caeni]|uniref:DUF4974 domain-containing protein n=1 Tax=Niastella caeni TaxID=2569763 RepID=A0A4S8HIA7_9BACT|nr:FecR family protein [Niastella caeni]THU34735.1 DUF4974 domain-containing protein [Niastella caeni]
MEKMNEVINLLYKHIREELTGEESIQLQNWVNESDENRKFFDKVTDTKRLLINARIKSDNLATIDLDEAWQELKKMGWEQPAEPKGKLRSFNWRWYAAAAAIMLLIAGYWWLAPRDAKESKPEVVQHETPKNDIEPGKYKAMLTLSDGRKIVLDSAMKGELAKQGNTAIVNKDGQLVYDVSKANSNGRSLEGAFNTLTTVKGETYAAILSDGSKVWLNSGSSIRYPVVFTGGERKVEITGEAYFEIAKDASKPFMVTVKDLTVQVLGTHFNINAYDEEAAIKTTLLEGSVSVQLKANSQRSIVIKPGQQAIRTTHDLRLPDGTSLKAGLTTYDSPNLEAVMAWKEGRFYFDGADITEIMRQLERWYNIEVVYEGPKPTHFFGGKMERNLNLSQVLRALEYAGAAFRIEGRKLIVIQ